MSLIIKWNLYVGIIITIVGCIGLVVWILDEFSKIPDGTTALSRIVIGSALIMISMGFYKVRHNYSESRTGNTVFIVCNRKNGAVISVHAHENDAEKMIEGLEDTRAVFEWAVLK